LIDLRNMLYGFMKEITLNKIVVYNEFSLQHELGIYLRNKIEGFQIQFERNVSFFSIKGKTIKKEMDISIFSCKEKYAIELKYPRNGQFPEQMYSFITDIKFMEEVKKEGFNKTFCLTLVDDKLFYEGVNNEGIYKYFRGDALINGEIQKPTGKTKDSVKIDGKYKIDWVHLYSNSESKFYLLEI
jgi:hypothetical protein